MPYRTNADLPASVSDRLPAAFNHAFATHAGDDLQEEIAPRTTWTAVKRPHVKAGDQWVPR
ncbi:ChaB family protein [Bradyrhizobium sp.]|uniref:ChaB family protein n=1 Tax=Bradyrhizobium sp. TaxID=376 RepID=UPI003C713B16